jgi:hypothetical protein
MFLRRSPTVPVATTVKLRARSRGDLDLFV